MDLECPYCEKGLDINHDDGFGYSEDVKHQMECPNCGKSFVFTTSILFYYKPEKADCLNGKKHKWQLTHTYPREWSRMRCEMCGSERDMTENERRMECIGTKQEYFEKLCNS